LFAAALAISPSLKKLDAENYILVKQVQIRILQVAMSGISVVYMVLALIGMLQARADGLASVFSLTLWEVILVVLALAYSGFTDIPYNIAILKWNPKNPPADWAKTRDAWDFANYVRAVPCLIAFVLQITALTLLAR
ncbi:anthrone oxygenase family protein, partial [Armatimonas sp.]|uniref:anthrone oxygenase family protein n=1 Tax=Armatimonas sp. TaxID=1872638 RepID=UPI00286B3FE9